MPNIPFMIWEGAFSDNNIKNIIDRAEAQGLEEAGTMSGITEGVRQSKVTWFSDDLNMRDQIWDFVLEANRQWGFNVYKYADIQYTIYEGSNKGHYHWHSDVDWLSPIASQRKISITVQLSGPDEYEGGDFEIQGASLTPEYKTRGTVLAFPSYHMHRVAPVTSGVRRSLVAWFEGPSWR